MKQRHLLVGVKVRSHSSGRPDSQNLNVKILYHRKTHVHLLTQVISTRFYLVIYQISNGLVIIILSFHQKSNSDFGIHVSCTNTSVVVQWLGFLAFKLLYHVIIVITRVQSPESREHNIDIYSSAVNARVRTPATEIASSFSHFAIWHFAFCIVCLCVCVCAKERRDQTTNWYLALL